jgi:hypothetical protein
MYANGKLIWSLLALVTLLVAGNAIIFLYPRWEAGLLARAPLENENQGSCMKVSDFYSVHLTTFYMGGASDDAGSGKDRANGPGQYCDRIPATGLAIFTIDLLEEEARNQAVALSLSQYSPEGGLKVMKQIPAHPHPDGVLTLTSAMPEKGKYMLKVAFGDAKSKDDVIEMPITVGQ